MRKLHVRGNSDIQSQITFMIRSIILTLLFFFVSIMASQATYPSYYSHFYKGLVVLTGQTDTIRGYVLLEPSLYKDTILLPFDKYYNYAGSILLYERDTLELRTRPPVSYTHLTLPTIYSV